MYLKLTNDHTASFYDNESMNAESMKIRFKFNPCHYPFYFVTFCFEANITNDLRSKLKGFGVKMDVTDSKDDTKDYSEDFEYANEAKLEFHLYQNGEIGSCS